MSTTTITRTQTTAATRTTITSPATSLCGSSVRSASRAGSSRAPRRSWCS
jgi:hypothetical protein